MSKFERNAFYEALLLLRRDDPRRFERLSEATHRSLQFYERARDAAPAPEVSLGCEPIERRCDV